ncbi:MAG TPA: protein kinase, partial [Candidatus Cryosericum sp.]|nr:protein kinase [Candidatus Cryosericum sp.]
MEPEGRFINYVNVQRLTQGTTATIYLAQSTYTGAKVALKLFPTGVSPSEANPPACDPSRYFDTELEILLDNNCPNIGHLLDFGTTLDEQHQYLALEYVSGPDLQRATRDSSLETLLNLFLQLAHALGHLHHRGIIHGDLKPANVLVTHSVTGRARASASLIDFSSARDVTKPLGSFNPCLTVPFAAPELLRTRVPTTASDLYA